VPVVAEADVAVGGDRDPLLEHQRLQVEHQPIQPSRVGVGIADEHGPAVALWGGLSRSVPVLILLPDRACVHHPVPALFLG
jgi:hypothetical protein